MRSVLIFVIGVFVGGCLVLFYGPAKQIEQLKPLPAATTNTVAPSSAVAVAPPAPAPTSAAQTTTAGISEPVFVAPPVVLIGDNLLIPVKGLRANQLTDTFNQSRGSSRSHEAIDIMAPKGTPVIAAADGKVVKLFNSKQGGLTVYQFDTREKLAYYYAHLDAYASGLAEGQQLKRGDLVGYVGSTGNASPDAPHLHFAIFELGPEKQWWKGTPINPYPLLIDQ
jgi:peptidoglycan LD-endopeptidase LytH